MRQTYIALFIASTLAFCITPASAQLGGLKLPGIGAGNSSADQAKGPDIDTFLKTAETADGLVRKSGEVLFQAVATKDELAAHEANVKAANVVADPKEKEAALKKAAEDQQATLAKVDFNERAKVASTNLDAQRKKQVGSAIWNFTLGMLKNKELLEQGKGVVSAASSNPMAATKLIKAKDVMSSVSSQMGNIGKIATGIQKLSAAVGVDKLPTKSSDTPVAAAD